MYTTHFLQGKGVLSKDVQHLVEQSVLKVYGEVYEDLKFEDCSVFVAVNPKKILNGEMFLGFSYDHDAIYLFADDAELNRKIFIDRDQIKLDAAEHLYRSLYATARARHMGLDADCGLIEEVISEGLSEKFVTEKMSVRPRGRYVQFSEAEIKRLWEKMKSEFDDVYPDVEKWFWGNDSEGVPPFTACSVGFAVVEAYLDGIKKGSVDALVTSARDMVVLQNRY